MSHRTTRRNLLLSAMTMMGSIACKRQENQSLAMPIPTKPMPERPLGKTGLSLPLLGLGGAGKTPLSKWGEEKNSYDLIEAAIRLGIRYFDTAANYGPSEDYLGVALRPYRPQIILASKTAQRNRDGAWRELEKSLKRLNTDYLDIWQLHHVSFMEELDQIFAKNGAVKAIEEAKEQKLIRFSGITGHHEPDVIAEGIGRYPFDMTLISLNASDIHHPRPFSSTVLPTAQEKEVGVIGMKIPAYGRLLKQGGLNGMEEAMGYVLSLEGVNSCIIAAENIPQLTSNVKVAQNYQSLDSIAMEKIEQKTVNLWQETTFFRQWT
ncbi:MAG: aldo/keto reductase [Microcystaceae cyanobacterium]